MTNDTSSARYMLSINDIARDDLIALVKTIRPTISDDDFDALDTLDYLEELVENALPGPSINGVSVMDLADTLRDAADAVDDAYNLASTTYYRMAEDALEVLRNGL